MTPQTIDACASLCHAASPEHPPQLEEFTTAIRIFTVCVESSDQAGLSAPALNGIRHPFPTWDTYLPLHRWIGPSLGNVKHAYRNDTVYTHPSPFDFAPLRSGRAVVSPVRAERNP